MKLYEVIFYGAHDADIIYLVRASDFREAIEVACHSLSSKHHDLSKGCPIPDLVYELAEDLSLCGAALPLRGPYVQPAYNYSWRRWEREPDWTGAGNVEWKEIPHEE